jgi:hypothetical protein
MARILAYVVPAAGHLFPFVPGLQELQRRGHHVHVRTGEKLLATAREAGLDVSPADPGIAAIEVNDYAEGKDTDKFGKGLHDMLRRGPLARPRRRAVQARGAPVRALDAPAPERPARRGRAA